MRLTDGEQTELSKLAFENIHTYVTFVLLPKEAWAHRDQKMFVVLFF